MSERKPKVDPRVPTVAVDRMLARTHVSTSDDKVRAMVQERIDWAMNKGPERETWTPAMARQTIRYALWRHHKNQEAYRQVMGGSGAWSRAR